MSRIPPPSPKARRLLGVIAESIARGEIREGRPWTFLSYSGALEKLHEPKPAFRPGSRLQKRGLDDLNDWTREFAELPKVAALIVDKKTMRPNAQFARSHDVNTEGTAWLDWWIEQANLSIRFDWTPYADATIAESYPANISGWSVAEDAHAVAPDVRNILRWLAAGQSEADILRQHPELTISDIRASLARAAETLPPSVNPGPRQDAPSTLASRWAGAFSLPDADPSDPRLTYLLERYHRHRE